MDAKKQDGVTMVALNEEESATFQKALQHALKYTEDEAEARTIAAAADLLARMAGQTP